MTTVHDGTDDGDALTSAYSEPPPPPTPDDRQTRLGYRGTVGLGSRGAPPRTTTPGRSFDEDYGEEELTETLLRGGPASNRAADRNQLARVVLTLGLTASVVVLVFLGVILRLPPSDFAQYIAPLTGIAGLALGYWFGSDSNRYR